MSTHLDGNVLAGALGELFAMDVTTATGTCGSCGTSGSLAQARVYPDAPGMVARCPACGEMLLRVSRGPGRAWLDLRGMSCLEFPMPAR